MTYRRQLETLVGKFKGRCLQMAPVMAVGGAEKLDTLECLEKKPIMNKEGAEGVRGQPWAPAGSADAVRRDLRRRLSEGAASDPLFRTAVEAAVFRRVRKTGEDPSQVWAAEAGTLAEELRKTLDTGPEE